jgi:hypothetical protein
VCDNRGDNNPLKKMAGVIRQLLESVDDLQVSIPQLLAELRKFDDVCCDI